jgi:hypothetical protein
VQVLEILHLLVVWIKWLGIDLELGVLLLLKGSCFVHVLHHKCIWLQVLAVLTPLLWLTGDGRRIKTHLAELLFHDILLFF